jgi:mxaD protein
MSHAVVSVSIARSADALWQEIGSFGGIGAWHPMLDRVESTGERAGSCRTAHGKDGSEQVERLQQTMPHRHLYRYTIERSALPIRDYVGELKVDDNGNDTSTVTWASYFDVTDGEEAKVERKIEGFLQAGLDRLKQRYG